MKANDLLHALFQLHLTSKYFYINFHMLTLIVVIIIIMNCIVSYTFDNIR